MYAGVDIYFSTSETIMNTRKKTASLTKIAGKTGNPQREGRSAVPDNRPTKKAKQSKDLS